MAHASHDMGGLGGDDAAAGGHMIMTFFTATNTPLYSLGWTPTSTGSYAGTCIFLILLAVLFRVLLAGKAWKEERWLDEELKRRYIAVEGRGSLAMRIRGQDGRSAEEGDAKSMVISENGLEEDVVVVTKKGPITRPWRWSVDLVRASMDTCIAGVGYLL